MRGLKDTWLRLIAMRSDRRVVAAVPVRASAAGGLEFLLVRTRDGERWTFPKGGCEPGETPVRAAAREAIEEAGVTGQFGAEPLAEYRYDDDLVTAFLLMVERDDLPPESARDPSWFDLEAARSKLGEGRSAGFAAEMERVLLTVQRAVAE